MLDLRAIADEAKRLHAEQCPDSNWDELEDWMHLSWFMEACLELEASLG